MDKFVSCNRTRPPGILDDDCTLQLPRHDSQYDAGDDSTCPTLGEMESASACSPSPFALAISISSLLAKTARCSLSSRHKGSGTVPWDPTSDFASISSKLAFFESQFLIGDPTHLASAIRSSVSTPAISQRKPSHLVLANTLWHLCQCLLNHPILLLRKPSIMNGNSHGRRNFLRRAFESAREHASTLSEILRDTVESGFPLRSSVYDYCVMISSTIHVLGLHTPNEAHRLETAHLLKCNKQILKDLAPHWRSASIIVSVNIRCEFMRLNTHNFQSFSHCGILRMTAFNIRAYFLLIRRSIQVI